LQVGATHCRLEGGLAEQQSLQSNKVRPPEQHCRVLKQAACSAGQLAALVVSRAPDLLLLLLLALCLLRRQAAA
jgi:hypothetical protein